MIKAKKKAKAVAPLPARDGIAPSRVWLAEGGWSTIGQFLVERFPHVAEADLRWRLARGDIVDTAGQPMAFDMPYQPHAKQWLWYYRHVPDEVPVPFEMPILYADDTLIVVDKPHFLASTPGGQYLQHTALTRVRQHFDDVAISPLHRLDRETAGILLFCRKPELRGAYQTLFQNQQVQRVYEAIAPAQPDSSIQFPLRYSSRLEQAKGQLFVEEVPGEPNSHTDIEVLKNFQDTPSEKRPMAAICLYQLRPLTGRKHQLRVHLNALGTPILNDSYYPARPAEPQPDDYSKPLQLLARSIAFVDPVSGQQREFVSKRQLIIAGKARFSLGE